jgi:choline dehydrogenase-like flavoprotein
MMYDLRTMDFQAFPKPQVIIVGAGAVGLIMAVDLSRSGYRVLVLEAGPQYMTKSSQSFIETAAWEGFPLVGLHLGRVRALGGTTNLWGGQLVPMEPAVFQTRPWLNAGVWPISEAELAPYYKHAFHLLGMEKQIDDDREIWQRLKISPPDNSTDIDLFFTRWAPEPNFARLYDGDIRRNPNLCVIVEAQVAALDLSCCA